MEEKEVYSSTRTRRNRSDLIDLSQEIDESRGNNILNLFDPLSHNTTNQLNVPSTKQTDRARLSFNSSRPLVLRRQDRRFRTSSTCGTKQIEIINTKSINKVGEQQIFNRSTNNSDYSTPSKNSTLPSHNSDSSLNITTSTENNEINKRLNKLSFQSNSSNSINQLPDSTTTDLNSAFDKKPFNIDRTSNKLELSRKLQKSSKEIILLTQKLKSFRLQYKHHDRASNPGLVYSPTLYSSKFRDMSVKIIITSPLASSPINFTCNVSTTIEHLISHAVCSMFEDLKEGDSMENYMLKVTGKDEYFNSKLCLADYALVSHCWKFDLDVQLTLIKDDCVKRPFLRTSKDDYRCKSLLCPDDLLSQRAVLKYSDLNYEFLSIAIEAFGRESERLYSDVTNRHNQIQTVSLLQATKQICSLMMSCETSQLTDSKNNLAELCKSYKDEGEQLRSEDRYKMIEIIQHAIKLLVRNMHRLLKVTSDSLPVDYEVIDLIEVSNSSRKSFVDTPIDLVKEQVSLRIQLISQLKPEWVSDYQEFYLNVELKHGENELCLPVTTSSIRIDKSFFHRLCFDEELVFSLPYCNLPREARIVVTLFGIEAQQPSTGLTATSNSNMNLHVPDELILVRRSGSSTSIDSQAPMYSSSPKGSQIYGNLKQSSNEPTQSSLAVAMAYIFDAELNLRQGDLLVYMYPLVDDLEGDIYLETYSDRKDPVLFLEFKRFALEKKIHFPQQLTHNDYLNDKTHKEIETLDFDQLSSGVKYVLNSVINEKQCFEKLMDDEKTLLWNNRLYLTSIPAALPKVLLSAPDWSLSNLVHIYQLIDCWKPLEAIDAIQLLLPSFPDSQVRKSAIDLISKQEDDELCDYLPQLLQAFRYEKNLDCPLFWLLIERALKSVRIANLIYWQLKLNASDKIFQERSETLISCLLWMCGAAFWKSIDEQEKLLKKLTLVSNAIKEESDSHRMSVLNKKLEHIQDYLMENKPTMPWAPSLEVCDLDIRSCSYFPSNTLPLKLAFRSCEESCNRSIKFYTYDTIFKMGDDLRQDMLAIQMIRIMEKLWLREGLDLRMVTFDCLATNDRQGMVEMVQNAETLRKIQQSTSGLLSTNPRAIDNYIRLWNTSELEYKTALDKFLHSCAGYSVATYILGICDRHNDNIMITNSGHLFHIDFGKFLGDAQMMGSIKRDRTPFVLTPDMAYVINGGDKPSKKFQTFIELCTMGFNIIRRHRNLFLNLFSLMSSAKIHGLNRDSVSYIDRMLMPNLTETEAMAKFTRLIDECLNSRSTQVNFFIHSLAQLRFSNDNSRQTLLSFVPKTFSIQTEGKIESLEIVNLYKKYEPEKQYYYVVRVKRFNQPDFTDITRTFREFSELQMKLNCMFPHDYFHDINKSTNSFLMDFVSRTNNRDVAERRLIELKIFLKQLLTLPPEISQCDLIYTFFHPILRDQTTNSTDVSLMNESSSTFGSQEYSDTQRSALYLGSKGQVKLKLSYKNSSLIIMIMHAKNLVCPEGVVEPNCYAKTYLLPDPHKQTKKKTKVVRKGCHPSFMELIVYELPLNALKVLTLKVSIWHHEIVHNKFFMGSTIIPLAKIDLTKETTSWYALKDF